MKLNGLHLVNFRQHADTRIEFDTGLTGIIGPNGSGKTTILEAIAWALYGNPAVRGTRDSIRFNRAGARAGVQVTLDFDLGGHRYRVDRRLTSAELYLDGATTPIASSTTGVTDLLHRRLGMSRQEFFNTYFTGQKELNVMAAMGPAERAKFLSRVLGYERLKTAQDLVRDRRRMLTAEIAGLRSALPDPDVVQRAARDAAARLAAAQVQAAALERRYAETSAVLAQLAPRWSAAQAERERLQELTASLRVAESERTSLARDVERLDRDLAELATARGQLATLNRELDPLPALIAELQRFDALCREEGRRQTLQESVRALNDELARMRDRRVKIETAPRLEEDATLDLERKRQELEALQGRVEALRTEWVRDRQEADTKLQALREQYSDLKAQRDRVASLGEEGACPTCTRPLGASYRAVLDMLDEQLETVRVDGRYFGSRVEQLADMPDEVKTLDDQRRAATQEVGALERRLAKVQLAVHELTQLVRDVAAKEQRQATLQRDLAEIPSGYDSARHTYLRAEVDRLTPLDARRARLGAQVDREPQLRRERERVDRGVAGVAARLTDLGRQQSEIRVSETEYAELRAAFEVASADARAAELGAVGARGDVKTAAEAVESARHSLAELARMQDRLATLRRDHRLHDELDRAYSDLRTDLNFQLRPELSDLASAFLRDLTDGRYSELELDDQYNILVLEDGIPKPVISGGEEDLANLVLRLAISQMIAERAGQAFSLLILDEVFGSLDELRRHNVVELLRGLHDRFEQVILITHIESVREGLDRVITVRYDEERGSSLVEQNEPGVSPATPPDELALERMEAAS